MLKHNLKLLNLYRHYIFAIPHTWYYVFSLKQRCSIQIVTESVTITIYSSYYPINMT